LYEYISALHLRELGKHLKLFVLTMNLYCKGPIKITLSLPRKLSPAEMTFLRPPQIVHPENTTNQRSRSNLTRLHHHPVAMGSSRLQRNSVQASNVTPSLRATDVNSHGRPGFDSQYPRPIFFSCKKKSWAASVDAPSAPAPTALSAAVMGAHGLLHPPAPPWP
jgi:hypothetical protein